MGKRYELEFNLAWSGYQYWSRCGCEHCYEIFHKHYRAASRERDSSSFDEPMNVMSNAIRNHENRRKRNA